MNYISTRANSVKVSSSQAITKGISEEGGLFVPETLPELTLANIDTLSKMDYIGRAESILSMFLTDFTDVEIENCVKGAYRNGSFSDPAVAPVVCLEDGINILELWKGPTCAFKDMALQILPRLMTVSAGKTAKGTEIVILVATSCDTGKAAL